MIYEDPEEFQSILPPLSTMIGLDLGTKTIGVAFSDRLQSIANAALVIKRKKFTEDANILDQLVSEHEIGAVVIGLPKNMDGSEGPRAQSSRAFARNWQKKRGTAALPVLLWDERLSTVEAERAMIEADMSRKKRAEKIDAVAASLILQGALERLQVIKNG